MSTGKANENLHVLFGKAFLLELERGNLETAAVFARAFLLRKAWMAKHQSVTFARGGRVACRSSKTHRRRRRLRTVRRRGRQRDGTSRVDRSSRRPDEGGR